jgi:preprotein translocase subunit SecG
MSIFVTVLHVLVCVILIVVVLLQRGKGAEIGAVFGGGASSTVFGSRGAGNFFTKLTTGAAIVFMVTSLVLSYLNTRTGDSLLDEIDEPGAEQSAPAPDEAPGGFAEVPTAPAAPAPSDAPKDAPAP